MVSNNISGEKIEITTSDKYIYSDKYGVISTSREHWAIRKGNMVYDNMNPNGISYDA